MHYQTETVLCGGAGWCSCCGQWQCKRPAQAQAHGHLGTAERWMISDMQVVHCDCDGHARTSRGDGARLASLARSDIRPHGVSHNANANAQRPGLGIELATAGRPLSSSSFPKSALGATAAYRGVADYADCRAYLLRTVCRREGRPDTTAERNPATERNTAPMG
jgi:hypothetical protein